MSSAERDQRRQLPSRRVVLAELKKEIIADNKFFNTIVGAIITGTTNCSGDGSTEKNESTATRTGILVQSDSGGGKTVLLQSLLQIYGGNSCFLLNSKDLVTKNRGDTESFLLALFDDCISTGRQLLLLDDIDNLAPNRDHLSTVTDNYVLSTLICGIDTIIQKHNRENSHRKIFIVATSSSDKGVSDSLLVPYRLGDNSTIVKLPFPSQKQRLSIIQGLLHCEGVNIIWDFDRDGYGKYAYSTTQNVHRLGEGCGQSLEQPNSEESELAESDEASNIFNLSLTLSNRTQGASVSDLILALKACYLSSVIAKVSQEELTRLPISGSTSSSSSRLFSPLRDMKNLQDISDDSFAHITVRASDFVRAINEIKPAVAQKNNMLSMIVGSDSTNDGCNGIMDTLVCVGDLQKRLKDAVLPNYLEQTNNYENYNDFDPTVQDKTMRVVGHCSGILIHGPSGCGKTSLARWLAVECQGYFKFLSVACADLVHKVVGESEKQLSHIFSAAREMAPCFLLLDNLEIILGSSGSTGSQGIRSGRRTAHQALDRLLSTLLVEIDGLSSSRTLSKLRKTTSKAVTEANQTEENTGVNEEDEGDEGEEEESRSKSVIVIATTSDINLIDRSLIRPGRLEEHIAMHLPTASERSVMLTHFADEMLGEQYTFSKNQYSEEESVFIDKARENLRAHPNAHEMSKLRSPGDIKNYLQEKALKAIRMHITPSLSAQISTSQSDATVTLDRNKDHVIMLT